MTSASGTYVSVDDGAVDEMAAGYVGGLPLLNDKYTLTFNLIQDLFPTVEDTLEELKDTITSLTIPADAYDRVRAVSVVSVPSINTNAVAVPGTLTLPGFDNVIFPIAPVLKTAPDIDLTYTAPTKPASVNPALGYTMSAYSSDVWLDLFTKVLEGIVTEGEGLGSGVEAAIWDRGLSRQQEENETFFNNAVADLGNRAVPYPTLARRSIEMQAGTVILRRRTDLNSDITIEQARLAQAHYHKMLESALDLEKIARAFYQVQETLSLDAAKAAAQLIIDNYRAALTGFIAEWDGIGKDLTAKVEAVNVILSENKVLGELYDTSTRGSIAQTQAISAERQSLVDAHRAEVDTYAAKVRAQNDIYNALNENQKTQLEASRVKLTQAVEELKALVELTTSAGGVRERVLEAIGQISSQVMASALNAVHTSIGHSTSASESRTESIGFHGSINESHNYEHDPSA